MGAATGAAGAGAASLTAACVTSAGFGRGGTTYVKASVFY